MLKEYIAYLKDNPKGYWFKRKLYGWGWTPATREGWFVICVYVVFLLFVVFNFSKDAEALDVLVPVFAVTISLLYISYRTGEKPGWMWGLPKKYKK